jgi:1-deoxy-D-xylulose-5-phosphate reductoisomerase
MKMGGTATAIFSAANEVAVQAFLDGKIGFLDIEKIIEATLTQSKPETLANLDVLLQADQEARAFAGEQVEKVRTKK